MTSINPHIDDICNIPSYFHYIFLYLRDCLDIVQFAGAGNDFRHLCHGEQFMRFGNQPASLADFYLTENVM